MPTQLTFFPRYGRSPSVHGTRTGQRSILTLARDDVITTVIGKYYRGVIVAIGFRTAKGRRLGPFGRFDLGRTFVVQSHKATITFP